MESPKKAKYSRANGCVITPPVEIIYIILHFAIKTVTDVRKFRQVSHSWKTISEKIAKDKRVTIDLAELLLRLLDKELIFGALIAVNSDSEGVYESKVLKLPGSTELFYLKCWGVGKIRPCMTPDLEKNWLWSDKDRRLYGYWNAVKHTIPNIIAHTDTLDSEYYAVSFFVGTGNLEPLKKHPIWKTISSASIAIVTDLHGGKEEHEYTIPVNEVRAVLGDPKFQNRLFYYTK